jgi:hypothetical protein
MTGERTAGRGVGRGGALSGLRASRMHGEHRHMGSDVAGRTAELTRVAEESGHSTASFVAGS